MKHVDMRKLPAAAQEERRRQVIGLRQAGQTYDAIAAQVGLSPTGVFDICKRFAEQGAAGLRTGPRGPEPGHGRFLDAEQEAEARDLIRRHTPDELDLPFALWSRAAVRELILRRLGVRLDHKRAGLGPVSAVTNKGELRWMVLDGAVKAPDLLRFLARLVRDADR